MLSRFGLPSTTKIVSRSRSLFLSECSPFNTSKVSFVTLEAGNAGDSSFKCSGHKISPGPGWLVHPYQLLVLKCFRSIVGRNWPIHKKIGRCIQHRRIHLAIIFECIEMLKPQLVTTSHKVKDDDMYIVL